MASYVNKLTGEVLTDPFAARKLNAEIPGSIRKLHEDDEPTMSPVPKQTSILPLFSHFKPPPQSAVPKPEEVVRKFLEVDGFSRALPPVIAINPYAQNYLDGLQGSDAEQKKVGFITLQNPNQYSFSTARADASAYSAMAYLVSQTTTTPEMKEDMKKFVERINEQCYGGGTLSGLLTRLKSRLVRHRPLKTFTSPTKSQIQKEVQDLHGLLKFDTSRLVSLVGKTIDTVGVKINSKAAAGSPFLDPSAPISKVAGDVATQALILFSHAQEGYKSFRKYMMERREFGLVCLKNKREKFDRKDYSTKVRPYYVFPGAPRLLYTALVDNLYAPPLLRFDEDPLSSSALGFSWANGGAKKMIDWFYCHSVSGVYAIVYGDDIWLLFVLDTSAGLQRVLVAVDLSSLDMTIGADTIRIHHELYHPMISNLMDPTWAVINIVYLSNLVEAEVLVYKNAVVHKVTGLNSGVNGTTIVDITASCRAIALVRNEFNANPIKEPFKVKEFMGKMSARVKSELGFEMKLADMVYDTLPMERNNFHSTEGRFLGMRLITRKYQVKGEMVDLYFPEPDFPNLASSLVHFEVTGVDRHNLAAVGGVKMVRMFGILVSGAWLNKSLVAIIDRMWTEAVKQGWSPFNISSEMETFELLDSVRGEAVEYLQKAKRDKALVLPNEEWFVRLYTGHTIDTLVKTQVDFDDVDLGFESMVDFLTGNPTSASSAVTPRLSINTDLSKRPLPPPPPGRKPAPPADVDLFSQFDQLAIEHFGGQPAAENKEKDKDERTAPSDNMGAVMRRVEDSLGVLHTIAPSTETPNPIQVSAATLEKSVPAKQAMLLGKNPVLRRIKEMRWYNNELRRKAQLESRAAQYRARGYGKSKRYREDQDEDLVETLAEMDEIEEGIAEEQAKWEHEELIQMEKLAEDLMRKRAEEEKEDFKRKDWADFEDDEFDYIDQYLGDGFGGYARGAFGADAT